MTAPADRLGALSAVRRVAQGGSGQGVGTALQLDLGFCPWDLFALRDTTQFLVIANQKLPSTRAVCRECSAGRVCEAALRPCRPEALKYSALKIKYFEI